MFPSQEVVQAPRHGSTVTCSKTAADGLLSFAAATARPTRGFFGRPLMIMPLSRLQVVPSSE